jgi:Zinc carboxypeptidase
MLRSLAATAVLSLACSTAHAVTLDANFDHASLKAYTLTNGTTATPTVNLTGRTNYFGAWRWLHFRADGVLNTRPTFSITDAFAGGASALNTQKMVYSYDGLNWNFFDNNGRSGGRFNFSTAANFTSDSVYVAFAPAYSYGKSVAHTKAVIDSPWATPTVSGDAEGIIGLSPGGIDDMNRVVAPREIYAYRISDPATDSPTRIKKKIVLATGLHSNEVLGTHTYQGIIDFLVSDDPHAAVLRNVAEFYCYPTLNPDGRFAGNNRTTVQAVNSDPNGFWSPTNWATHQDIKENGEAMIADTAVTPGTGPGNGVDAFIDFHSTIPAFPGDDFGFIEYEQGDHLAPFWTNFKALQPNVLDTDSTGTNWTSANFAEAYLGAKVDITFETQFGKARPVSFYNDMGRNLGLAFEQAYRPTTGDTNFDGAVDFADLLALAQHYNLTGSAYWMDGDFDFDRDVDFTDLLALAQHYGSAALFQSDWTLARSLVPEPTTPAALMLLLRRRRREPAQR